MKKELIGALMLAAFVAEPAMAGSHEEAHGITDVRYDVTWNLETAARREIHVEMTFRVDDDETVTLSLPSWTPGSYQLDDYARNVRNMWASQADHAVRWDKADFDSWRVYPTGGGEVTVGFDYYADQLDTGSAWSSPDFVFFNGTNLFLFPEDGGLAFESRVVFHTEDDWEVATGLTSGDEDLVFVANDFHELVDMPTFVGIFDVDSMRVGGTWHRLATYPTGALAGERRAAMWDEIQKMMPPMEAVMDDVPWETYTTLQVFAPDFGGGSALEHSNSHLGIYTSQLIGSPILPLVTAHEIFHAWNVKRLRPADMWPYDYGRQMPTELLWISEGITDYYADLAMVRGGITPASFFYETTQGKIGEVGGTVPVALEDASLSAWIGTRDGTSSIYYPKGSLAGFMLDVLIRDATDNQQSLDDVMKSVYGEAYLHGRGFTEEQWWNAVTSASGGRDFAAFHDDYVDGREPYPWEEILPLAGLELVSETSSVARIGISTSTDDEGVHIVSVVSGGSGALAGAQAGDDLVSLGGIEAVDASFGAHFRARFGDQAPGTPYEMVVRRDGVEITLQTELQFSDVTTTELSEVENAPAKARRIRAGILTGTTGG